jgi:DNA-binding MarR family transcriptional regulator
MSQKLRNLGFLIKDVSRLYVKYFEREAAEHGLSLGSCKALVTLSRNEGTTQAKLAELSETDPMTLVRILDRMEGDGLLERRPDPADRRAYRLHLKPSAKPVLEEIFRIGDRVRGEALSGLSSEERVQLVDLLERVHGNLTSLVPK